MRISDWSSDVCSSDLLNAEFEVTPSIRLFSQSAYSKDFYSSTQDYNRFVSNSVFNDSSGLYQLNRKPVPTDGVSPGGVLTDPQLGVSDKSEEHTSELQSLMRNSYAVFCLKKKKNI